MQMPDNRGERRECLNILEKVDWKKGLLHDLVTDCEVSPDTNTERMILTMSIIFDHFV